HPCSRVTYFGRVLEVHAAALRTPSTDELESIAAPFPFVGPLPFPPAARRRRGRPPRPRPPLLATIVRPAAARGRRSAAPAFPRAGRKCVARPDRRRAGRGAGTASTGTGVDGDGVDGDGVDGDGVDAPSKRRRP